MALRTARRPSEGLPWSPLSRRRSKRLCAHLGGVVRLDVDDHPLVTGLVVRILVHPEVLLGPRVAKVQIRVFLDADDLAPDFEVTVRVLRVHDGQSNARVPAYVAVLLAGLRLAELEVFTVPVE